MKAVVSAPAKKNGIMRKIGRLFIIILGAAVLFLGGTFLYEKFSSSKAKERYPHPGIMADAGGYKLHLVKKGSGSPTLLFESGTGAPASYWKKVVSKLPDDVTVVTYDRAGYGWSGKHVTKRTGNNIAAELHTALKNAKIEGPYILIGHSMGGMYARQFQKQFEDEVTGMMLLDARSEDFAKRTNPILLKAGKDPETFGSPPVALMKAMKSSGLLRVFKQPLLGGLYDSERELNEAVNIHMTDKYFDALAAESNGEKSTEAALQGQKAGSIPLTVISKGIRQDLTKLGLSEKDSNRFEDIWDEEQKKLAELSPDSKWLKAKKSGHDIALDEPGLVADELIELIERVRVSQ